MKKRLGKTRFFDEDQTIHQIFLDVLQLLARLFAMSLGMTSYVKTVTNNKTTDQNMNSKSIQSLVGR
ncbi:hypothetical protein [Undibacterium sp.]|uniref:hypothetical protein n=1 Tax=Undibacterium sp. TaxID=1914977 RepID=UPI0037516F85